MITIEKAIETLTDLITRCDPLDMKKDITALKLGIEALKRVLDVRRFPDASNWKPLPGETEK